ncbi:uncharacterized protein BX664DRAFT_339297 [Halteromyces radiatus]|uniref:uncharacterized protein n=1 Tax=Halteromyces radiatus TaxID=101107 RepID=UPI00221F7667|nr:uncharacterized protein BX664DRAFT_339297 [Halteromyces radiatus]KAI8082870.1 hypothetical protein BX664DRAFT_339297 [Halteromyces radiatus]
MVSTIVKTNKKCVNGSAKGNHKERKSSRYERKINKAKLKAREEIDLFEWNKWQFAKKDFWIDPFVDTVPRIDCRQVSKQEFIDNFETPNIPVVLIHGTDHWKAHTSWTEKYFSDRYGKDLYKVGEDNEGNNVYMKMKHFLHYCHHDAKKDDSPLYIFDSGFYKDRKKKKPQQSSSSSDNDDDDKMKEQHLDSGSLLDDYEVPDYFADDLFKLAGSQRRPPYRWLVIGEARSGTGIHTDPLGTSAWNALLKGHKRWALFPPNTPKNIVDPPMKPYDHEGVSWFSQVFPKFHMRDDPTDVRTLGQRLGMVEVLQRPGEIIFVPGGWHHVVMNLDMTIAVTQNFCSPTNAEYVYLSTRHSRPKLGARLYRRLQKLGNKYPDSIYAKVAAQLRTLQHTPQIPPSSSDSSSSSSTSSSSGSSSSSSIDTYITLPTTSSTTTKKLTKRKRKLIISSTESETDLSDGTCMCLKCKRKRKKERIKKNGASPSKSTSDS